MVGIENLCLIFLIIRYLFKIYEIYLSSPFGKLKNKIVICDIIQNVSTNIMLVSKSYLCKKL